MQQTCTLYELTSSVQEAIAGSFPGNYWVTAEVSELRVNASGHCYLELVEKSPSGKGLVARARAIIWNNLYPSLKTYFEEETQQMLMSGIKVLVQVQVEFHPLYGFSLTINDINPSYTVGDLAMRRKEIVEQLKQEGILDLNKELPFPILPQRIAVISSDTAAGYGDFCNQLASDPHGYAFYPTLFPAVMQGEKVEKTIIQALDHISERLDDFDVVVIIRGGGATTDLAGFDSLALAENCAQFPLPIITGIGHERDDTILDLISHTRVKTPTAAAAFLISCLDRQAERLQNAIDSINKAVSLRMEKERTKVEGYSRRIPLLFTIVKGKGLTRLEELKEALNHSVQLAFTKKTHHLQMLDQYLRAGTNALLEKERTSLNLFAEKTKGADPVRILNQGYTLTLNNHKIVKDAGTLHAGDRLTTRFAKGEIQSTVN